MLLVLCRKGFHEREVRKNFRTAESLTKNISLVNGGVHILCGNFLSLFKLQREDF